MTSHGLGMNCLMRWNHFPTHALLKEAAPITVNCFAKNLKIYAEEIPFAGHRKTQTAGSGVFLLCPQYTDLYSDELGLHLPQEESFESIF